MDSPESRIEELSTEMRLRGFVNVHNNAMAALNAIDTNTEAIAQALERLRS